MQDPSLRSPTTAPIWLSNGAYSALLTATGTGFSLYGEHLLTSWQDDPCEDDLGFTIFLHDVASGSAWTACGPALAGCDTGVLSAQPSAAVLERRHGDLGARVQLEVLEQIGRAHV